MRADFTLVDLPYDYSALEPHISAKIMQLHHSKHHAAYVAGANAAIKELKQLAQTSNFAIINKLEKDLAFNIGGINNHNIFWTNLTPNYADPKGNIKDLLNSEFGGLDTFKAQFSAAALGIQGSGWAVLGIENTTKTVSTFQLFDQQNNIPLGITPLLMLDMWEHAFYLDYLNVKADYVAAFWNIVNWENVESRLNAALM